MRKRIELRLNDDLEMGIVTLTNRTADRERIATYSNAYPRRSNGKVADTIGCEHVAVASVRRNRKKQ